MKLLTLLLALVVGMAAVDAAGKPPPVCIIGGGPSGLTAASALMEKKIPVVVFEKNDRVGGKCKSVEYQGGKFDMGAALAVDTFYTFAALMKKYGAKPGLPRPEAVRLYSQSGLNVPRPEPNLLNTLALTRNFIHLSAQYPEVTTTPGYRSLDKNNSDYALTTAAWLNKYGLLQAMAPVTSVFLTSYGYGSAFEVPALYTMKYFSINLFLGFVNVQPIYYIDTTFGGLMQRFGADVPDVRLNVTITSVKRPKNGNHEIRYRRNGVSRTQKCRSTIVAFPQLLENMKFMDLNAEEKEVFGQVISYKYYSILFKLQANFTLPLRTTYINLLNGTGSPIEPVIEGSPVIITSTDTNVPVYTAYSLSRTPLPEETVKAKLRATVANLLQTTEPVILDSDIIDFNKWEDYFPHVPPASVAGNFYEKAERLQGKRKTYWASGLFSFELVNYVMEYAKDLIARKF